MGLFKFACNKLFSKPPLFTDLVQHGFADLTSTSPCIINEFLNRSTQSITH